MSGEYAKHLSRNLRRLRGDLGMTQVQFASKLGISQASLNRLEQASQNVSLKTIELLCRRLKVSPDKLLLTGE